MAILCPESSPNPSKRCRFFCTVVQDAFSYCHPCKQRSISYSSTEDDTPTSDFDDVQEEVMSMIRARAMERLQRKSTTSKQEDEEPEDFMSVQSHFSLCSSCAAAVAADSEAFFSVKSNFSHCSSVKDMNLHESKWWAWEGFLDSSEIRRRAIIQEFCHCEGWPFGLCRKVLLLPPLPKSPSEPWTWCKGTAKVVRMH